MAMANLTICPAPTTPSLLTSVAELRLHVELKRRIWLGSLSACLVKLMEAIVAVMDLNSSLKQETRCCFNFKTVKGWMNGLVGMRLGDADHGLG
jgi:hypothetical protein